MRTSYVFATGKARPSTRNDQGTQVTLDGKSHEGGHVFMRGIPLGSRSGNENQVAMA